MSTPLAFMFYAALFTFLSIHFISVDSISNPDEQLFSSYCTAVSVENGNPRILKLNQKDDTLSYSFNGTNIPVLQLVSFLWVSSQTISLNLMKASTAYLCGRHNLA